MRIISYLLLVKVFFSVTALQAQVNWQQKTDSVTRLIQQYYNAKKIDSLYALGADKFKQSTSAKKFEETALSLHSAAGPLLSYSFVSWKGKIASYKAQFNIPMSMYVSVDADGRYETLLISQWEEGDTLSKKTALLSNNPRKTILDRKVDSVFRPFITKPNTVGLVIGILKNKSVHVYGYGETQIGNRKIPDGNTLFEIGSISKTFTATLLADLVLQGKLSLNDPVNKYLPDSIHPLQYNGVPITIQTLSNHTSGLPRLPVDMFLNADPKNPYKHYDNVRLFNFLQRFKPVREPGKQYEYSNLAVGLLGVILERISGKSYEQLLDENILKLISMKNTRLTLQSADSMRFASGHNLQAERTSSWEFQSLAAAGGIRSSVNDMMSYSKAQVAHESSRLYKAIALTHQQTFDHGQNKVGLGWHSFTREGRKYFVHNGQTGGYCSMMVFNTESGSAVVILTNASVAVGDIPISLISWLDQN